MSHQLERLLERHIARGPARIRGMTWREAARADPPATERAAYLQTHRIGEELAEEFLRWLDLGEDVVDFITDHPMLSTPAGGDRPKAIDRTLDSLERAYGCGFHLVRREEIEEQLREAARRRW